MKRETQYIEMKLSYHSNILAYKPQLTVNILLINFYLVFGFNTVKSRIDPGHKDILSTFWGAYIRVFIFGGHFVLLSAYQDCKIYHYIN